MDASSFTATTSGDEARELQPDGPVGQPLAIRALQADVGGRIFDSLTDEVFLDVSQYGDAEPFYYPWTRILIAFGLLLSGAGGYLAPYFNSWFLPAGPAVMMMFPLRTSTEPSARLTPPALSWVAERISRSLLVWAIETGSRAAPRSKPQIATRQINVKRNVRLSSG